MNNDITFEEWLGAVRESEAPKNIVWTRDIAKQFSLNRNTFSDCVHRYGFWDKTIKVRSGRGLKEEDAKDLCLIMVREGY